MVVGDGVVVSGVGEGAVVLGDVVVVGGGSVVVSGGRVVTGAAVWVRFCHTNGVYTNCLSIVTTAEIETQINKAKMGITCPNRMSNPFTFLAACSTCAVGTTGTCILCNYKFSEFLICQ